MRDPNLYIHIHFHHLDQCGTISLDTVKSIQFLKLKTQILPSQTKLTDKDKFTYIYFRKLAIQ